MHHAYTECTKSVTDVYAYWATPSPENINPSKIIDINFSHPKNMGINYYTQFTFEPKSKSSYIKKVSVTLNDKNTFNTFFLSKLEAINSDASILKVVAPYNLKFIKNIFPKSLINLFNMYVILSREELVDIGSILDFSLDENDCNAIEKSNKL